MARPKKPKYEYVEKWNLFRKRIKDNPLFNDYAQRWMDLHSANLTFGGRTDYQSCIDCNIKPYMQGKRLKEIRPDDIRELMLGVTQKSESIYTKTYMLVKQILSSACENGYISTNPCPTMPKGGVPPRERQALTQKQIAVLLDAVEGTKACPRFVRASCVFMATAICSLMGTVRILPPLPLMVMAFSRRASYAMAVSTRKHSWMRSPA